MSARKDLSTGNLTSKSGPRRLRSTWRGMKHGFRKTAALVAIGTVALTGFVAPATAAHAAGNGVMSVTATPVNSVTAAPVTEAGVGLNNNRIAFQVSYSCSVDTCADATVTIDPAQLDPNHNHYRLMRYQSWTAPTTGGTISGNDASGFVVKLGTLTPGMSGTFTLVYDWALSGSGYVIETSDVAASNFPQGFPLTITMTADAATAVAPQSSVSAPVLWQITTPEPGIVAATAAATHTDTDFRYELRMGSGCMTYLQSMAKGNAAFLCADEYTVTHTLPAGAELVSATGNPTVAGNILTWESPVWSAGGPTAAVGWHTHNNWDGKQPRIITVRFPAEQFAPAGETCDFETTVTIDSEVSMTYIGMPGESGVTKTSTQSSNVSVFCVTPFTKGISSKNSSFDGNSRENNSTSVVTIPPVGEANEKFWEVHAGNQANIPGHGVIVDNTLDLADAPVFKITAERNATGATTYVSDPDAVIEWEATNGTLTETGSFMGTSLDIADLSQLTGADWRFSKATITSGELEGPNPRSNGTARVNSIVKFHYQVTSDAPTGELRTNTASTSITYPGSGLPDLDLGDKSHNIRFNAAFAKGLLAGKVSTGSGTVDGTVQVTVPNTGQTEQYWTVATRNQSNAKGVVTVTDADLDQPDMRVYQISAASAAQSVGATVDYELDDGTTGSSTLPYTAPSDRRIVSAVVTSGLMGAPNALPNHTSSTSFDVRFRYITTSEAPVGEYRSNTASATIEYPDYPELGVTDLGEATGQIRFAASKMNLNAGFLGSPVVTLDGVVQSGAATPATDVTFNVRGATSNVHPTVNVTPQYVFAAPAGWIITPGSASFPAGSAPEGVTFDYATKTIGGVEREVVVATWPNTEAFGKNTTWPAMSVTARPTFAAALGANTAHAYMGDSRHTFNNQEANYAAPYEDAADLDSDGATSEWFSSSNQTITVGAAAAMQVVKEICSPVEVSSESPDGCDWISDPSTTVGVSPDSTSITYRLTIRNSGNTDLSNVVGYDVLPYVGDTGTSDATASTPRGSTFQETVNSVFDFTPGITATYSTSTNPDRPEVYSGATSGSWNNTSANAQAIRMAYPGSLAPGESVSMSYTANVVDAPSSGALACNSLAVKATGIGTASEPSPVCAMVLEADLEAGGPDTVDAQLDRPAVFPFEFENLGGTAEAPAAVTVDIPEGVTVTNLDYAGWTCTADSAAPVAGAAQLTCTPESGLLVTGAPMQLNLETVVHTTTVAITATVAGTLFDTDLDNNPHTITAIVAPAAAEIAVVKTDSREAMLPGQETTYTISVTNPLLYEPLIDVVITDTLPEGTELVSASADGIHGSGEVIWQLSEIAAGATVDVTVTVLVAEDAPNTITNTVDVIGVDPVDEDNIVAGTATDVNSVNRVTLEKTGTVDDSAAPQAGDTVTFEFTATNTGGGVLSDVTLTDAMVGLSAIEIQSWPALPGYLGVGDSITATATYTLTQADVDAGVVENSAALTADTVDGDATGDTAIAEVPLTSAPALALEKTGVINGGEIEYTFTVTNDGNVTVTGVGLDDPMPGLSEIVFGTWPASEGILAPGESVAATASYTITQSDRDSGLVENTATVTGDTPQGDVVTGTDTEETNPPASPGIAITKNGSLESAGTVAAGDGVLYTFVVENTGDVTLTGVTITDPMPGLSALDYGAWPAADGTLAPGESVTATARYVLTQADVDAGVVDNTATATGTPAQGDAPTETDDDQIIIEAAPAVTLTKNGELGGVGVVGDDVTYTFTVTNDGNVTLTDVTIDDQMEDLSAITFGAWPAVDGTLAPGEGVTATATYTLTQADIDSGVVENTALVTGLSPAGDEVSDDDSFTVTPAANPGISLTKSSMLEGAATASAGDVIEYTFVLENTGDVTLSDVSLEDPLVGLSDIEFGAWASLPGYLGVGESVTATATYVLTQADVDAGEVSNSATATGTPTRGDAPTDADSDQVLLGAVPGVTIDKVGTLRGAGVAGDLIEYAFVVENTGNLTLTGVVVDDPMAGLSELAYSEWPAVQGTLAPGESVTATATYVITQADVDAGVVDNTATATGTPPRGDVPTSTGDDQIVIEAAPGLTVVKSGELDDANADESANLGESVSYSFAVSNTGNVTLVNVEVDDAMVTGIPMIETLAPGETVAVAADTYVVTEADVEAGVVLNTATVTGDLPDGSEVTSDPSTSEIPTKALTVSPDLQKDQEPELGRTGYDHTVLAGVAGFAGALMLVGLMIMIAAKRRRTDRHELM